MCTHEEEIELSPRYGRNESMVHCLYCKRAKTVKAFGKLTQERAHEMFGFVPIDMADEGGDERVEVKAPAEIFLDPIPCFGCAVAKKMPLGSVLFAELDESGCITGGFIGLKAPGVRQVLSGKQLHEATSKGYCVAGPETYKALQETADSRAGRKPSGKTPISC